MDSEKYKEKFGLGPAKDTELANRALECALDIRKFEIGLYWQRATYFWTLIAATLAGYFAVLSAEGMDDKEFNALVIACVGLVFSLAWFLVNKGSKFWQENWENHVDMLEDGLMGPLYKTVLQDDSKDKRILSYLGGPAPYSVSRINQWVSLFMVLVWVVLIGALMLPEFHWCGNFSVKHFFIVIITLGAIMVLFFGTKSKLGGEKKLTTEFRHTELP